MFDLIFYRHLTHRYRGPPSPTGECKRMRIAASLPTGECEVVRNKPKKPRLPPSFETLFRWVILGEFFVFILKKGGLSEDKPPFWSFT